MEVIFGGKRSECDQNLNEPEDMGTRPIDIFLKKAASVVRIKILRSFFTVVRTSLRDVNLFQIIDAKEIKNLNKYGCSK